MVSIEEHSTNGKYLLVDNVEPIGDVPADWQRSPFISSFAKPHWGFVIVSYLYDLATDKVTLSFKSPAVREGAVWSPDSNSFIRVAVPPVGSVWEAHEGSGSNVSDRNTHLFEVTIKTGEAREILASAETAPLS